MRKWGWSDNFVWLGPSFMARGLFLADAGNATTYLIPLFKALPHNLNFAI